MSFIFGWGFPEMSFHHNTDDKLRWLCECNESVSEQHRFCMHLSILLWRNAWKVKMISVLKGTNIEFRFPISPFILRLMVNLYLSFYLPPSLPSSFSLFHSFLLSFLSSFILFYLLLEFDILPHGSHMLFIISIFSLMTRFLLLYPQCYFRFG